MLTSTLGEAEFAEYHSGIVNAGVTSVWCAVHSVAWSDLHLAQPLLKLRGISNRAARLLERSFLESLSSHAVVFEDAPREAMFALTAKPWSPRPQFVTQSSLGEIREFDEPGWLKYGMEWRLTPLAGDRTLVETRTLCTPTDAIARRVFSAYWFAIRIGSGFIRRDMIAAIRRLSANSDRPGAKEIHE